MIETPGIVAMLLTNAGYALVERLERQKDVPSLLDDFERLVQAFGMTCFCIGNPAHARMKHANRRWDGNWPLDWELHYAAQDYLSCDPLVEEINRAPRCFRWSSIFARVDQGGRRIREDAAAFGFKEGLCVSIHGPHGALAGVSVAGSDYELSPHDEFALHLASLYLHAKLTALRGPARVNARLTPRERECLKWVAAGKTDWEISQILNISEQTAHGYVQNALTKLNARTRAQAVALAIAALQIQP
jgi:LuxR family quorum sensing-dependent transcriptional regulator